jgi:hypothetical protein
LPLGSRLEDSSPAEGDGFLRAMLSFGWEVKLWAFYIMLKNPSEYERDTS